MVDQHGPTDRYAPLFLVLIATLLLSPFLASGPAPRVAMVVLVGLVVLSSLRATGVGNWRSMLGLVGLGVAAVIPAAVASGTAVETIVLVIFAIGMAVGPPNIVRRIFEHDRITLELVVAALCAYLQIGFAFGFGYAAIDAVTSDLLAGASDQYFFDYIYFSFVTMTTVGFGDITAVTVLGRSLAIVETLLGQIFLVVLVAYLVGTLSSNGQALEKD